MDGLVHVSKLSDIALCTQVHHQAFHKDPALHHLPREFMSKITRFYDARNIMNLDTKYESAHNVHTILI